MKKLVTGAVIVAIPLVFLLLMFCRIQKTRCENELADLKKTDLLIEHSDAGEWIDFSNTWASDDCDPARDITYRPGLLFQFGEYRVDAAEVFEGVEFLDSEDKSVATYADAVWINIVSRYDDRPEEPIAPEDGFALYPNDVLSLECDDVIAGSCGDDVNEYCLRTRMISANMRTGDLLGDDDVPFVVMTYWQGPNGYRASAVQAKSACSGNEFRFSFGDDFRIDVYRRVDDSMELSDSYDYGVVDWIHVKTVAGSSDKNQTQPPPWEYP